MKDYADFLASKVHSVRQAAAELAEVAGTMPHDSDSMAALLDAAAMLEAVAADLAREFKL